MDNRFLLPTEDPTKQIGFRTKNGCFEPIEVVTTRSNPAIQGNTETIRITEVTKVLQSLNPSQQDEEQNITAAPAN